MNKRILSSGCLTGFAMLTACGTVARTGDEPRTYRTWSEPVVANERSTNSPAAASSAADTTSAAAVTAPVAQPAATTTTFASSGDVGRTEPLHPRDAKDHLGFKQGDWDFQILGSGGSDRDWHSGSGSLAAQLGYLLTDHWELAVRQSVAASDAPGVESSTVGVTQAAIDYHFGNGTFTPFLGLNAGRAYGETTDYWTGAPELGVKWWLKHDAYVMLMAEYEFPFENLSDIDNAFEDDGAFIYTVGIGLKF